MLRYKDKRDTPLVCDQHTERQAAELHTVAASSHLDVLWRPGLVNGFQCLSTTSRETMVPSWLNEIESRDLCHRAWAQNKASITLRELKRADGRPWLCTTTVSKSAILCFRMPFSDMYNEENQRKFIKISSCMPGEQPKPTNMPSQERKAIILAPKRKMRMWAYQHEIQHNENSKKSLT